MKNNKKQTRFNLRIKTWEMEVPYPNNLKLAVALGITHRPLIAISRAERIIQREFLDGGSRGQITLPATSFDIE